MKIDKELVSEVFKLNICEAYIENNILYFDMGLPLIQSINLYEFCHKNCKEWAFKNNYKIQSQINESNKGHSHITKKNDDCLAKGFFENTEIEAIIKASEYILKELNEKR